MNPSPLIFRDLLNEVRDRLTDDRMARLVVDVPSQMPALVAPRAGLRQTVLSLISNAFDASARLNSPVMVSVSAVDNAFRISVRDEGSGLTPEMMRRAGEPFFTTKEAGHGLGLGLFLARIFAERLGGSLRLESDRGTIAVLELPYYVATPDLS